MSFHTFRLYRLSTVSDMETTTVILPRDYYLNSTLKRQLVTEENRATNSTFIFHDHVNQVLLGLVLGTVSLLTVVMNILVLYAVKKERTLHTVGNLYIVSLSVADLIVGASVMPLNIVYLLENEWIFGQVVCRFWLVMDYVASTASIFSLFILCVDRYRSVRHPLKYLKYRTRARASVMISGAWLLSMTWVIPILGWHSFGAGDSKPKTENTCETDFQFVTWFKVLTAVLNFYVPSLMMLWFYVQIYMAVRKHYRQRGIINESVQSSSVRTGFAQHGQRHKTDLNEQNENTIHELSHGDGLLDQYSLEQPHEAKYITETRDEMNQNKYHYPPNLFTVPHNLELPSTKNFTRDMEAQHQSVLRGLENGTKEREGSSDPETSLKLTCLPPGILHSQPDDDKFEKMFVSENDCNVIVPNSIAGMSEITDISDVRAFTTVLDEDAALSYSSSAPSPWLHNDNPRVDSVNNLKQSWQKFCTNSKQYVQNLRLKKEIKAAKQLGFIMAAFMMCWIPYFVTFMVMAFCKTCVHHNLHMFTIWLGYINSTLNPLIYPLCNDNFKKTFKNILHIKS
ncbi:histamine H1 receptor-like [Acipenser ruthenus]|uniref:histamine H1 receptor-like n=1 Tax=Acipenser ruthenus TaxID=7906 RepID=UPI00145B7822|nr:histamine H1 receptor-like [Acipenser ruthenus]